MPSASPALQQVIGQLLTHDDWSSQDSEELTARAARVYEQFASRLTPLIGEAGVRSIFTRSATLMQADFAFLKARQDYRIEFRTIAANGRIVWVSQRARLTSAASYPTRMLGFMVDISERKRTEERLQQAVGNYQAS